MKKPASPEYRRKIANALKPTSCQDCEKLKEIIFTHIDPSTCTDREMEIIQPILDEQWKTMEE